MLKKVIKFWDKNPCNVNHSKKKIFVKGIFFGSKQKKIQS